MKDQSPRRVPDDLAATPDEIEAASKALTADEWLRLKKYADWRIGVLGSRADGRTGDTLFLAAVTSTRRWNKGNVDFYGFLRGAIRSISSNWARPNKQPGPATIEADLRQENEEGELFSPLDNVRALAPSPEQKVDAAQTLDAIEGLFKDDEKALMVLLSAREGYSPPEIRELWGLSQSDYNAIMTRIRRRARTVFQAGAHDRRGS